MSAAGEGFLWVLPRRLAKHLPQIVWAFQKAASETLKLFPPRIIAIAISTGGYPIRASTSLAAAADVISHFVSLLMFSLTVATIACLMH